jgi:diphthine synthase
MTFSLVGLGLGSIEDITYAGMKIVRDADEVYLEQYTSAFESSLAQIEAKLKCKVHLAFREHLENKGHILIDKAKTKHICLLVVGDVFSATTHISLFIEAKKAGIETNVIFNASVLNAVGIVGLELYKYGKTTSIPFTSKGIFTSYYNVILDNKRHGLHTLCLLDLELGPHEQRYMTIREAIVCCREARAEECRKRRHDCNRCCKAWQA